MIKICVTFNEGQDAFSCHAKFDDDDLNSFRGIVYEGQTDTHTYKLIYIKICKVAFGPTERRSIREDFESNNIHERTRRPELLLLFIEGL